MSNLVIVGAGMAGLLASRMLHHLNPKIYERQSSLPNNHNSVLRFRSDAVARATTIPFKRVPVLKAVHNSQGPVVDAISYSLKTTGKLQARSILSTEAAERWVAPPDLISKLAVSANIQYDTDVADMFPLWEEYHPHIISTIPLPAMMDMFGWDERPDFVRHEGWSCRLPLKKDLECSLNCTVYFPGDEPWYRASLCEGEIILEGVGQPKVEDEGWFPYSGRLLEHFGLERGHLDDSKEITFSPNKYQKIGELTPLERESAKRFIMHLTETYGIYSLGRFATWRPKVLLDDVVKDVRIISGMISEKSNYQSKIKEPFHG